MNVIIAFLGLIIYCVLVILEARIKVALYTILQRFEYHIYINNVSVGKCLSHSTR